MSAGIVATMARAAATVSPPYAAISMCGMVPIAFFPVNAPWPSAGTLAAPPMCALRPSPGCSSAWSVRAPNT